MEEYGGIQTNHYVRWRKRPKRWRGVATVTAPYSYDGMLGPEDGTEYVCSRCDSTFDDDQYLCPVCGTLTVERRPPSAES